MATVANIALKVARLVTDVLDGMAMLGTSSTLTDTLNLVQTNEYWNKGTLWINSGTHSGKMLQILGHALGVLTFQKQTSVLCTQQVETITVDGTCTGSGDATVVITCPRLPGSPITLSVPVLNTDTAAQMTTKIKAALNLSDITYYFDIGGGSTTITLTSKTAQSNAALLNVSLDNGTCSGITPAPTSANTTAGVAGPSYSVIRGAYPYRQIIQAINQALEETHITGDDDTLIGDGETLEFTLPNDVFDVKRVEYERYGYNERFPSHHWRELGTVIRFDYGYAPVDADVIHLIYRKPHDILTSYSDTIDQEINAEWLKYAAAAKLLLWGASQYGKTPEYMIEERMNIVLLALKTKRARRDIDIVIKTGAT